MAPAFSAHWLRGGAVAGFLLFAVPAFAKPQSSGDPAQQATKPPTDAEMAAAKQHFDSGARFFQEGNYAAAQAEFKAAYELSRLSAFLFNLGRTAEKQGRNEEALGYYERYLASNPPDAEDVKIKIGQLKQGAPQTALVVAPSLALDGGPTWLKGYAKMPPIPALATLGAGVVFLAIGIGTGAAALSTQSEVASAQGRYWTGDVSNLVNKGNALNNTAIAFDVLGGVALAGGAAWTGYWLYLRSKHNTSTTTPAQTPSAQILPTGNGLAVVGRF